MKIAVDQSPEDEQWYVKYNGNNNETMTVSEGFPTDNSALRHIADFYASMLEDIPVDRERLPYTIDITITDRDNNSREAGVSIGG